MLKMKYEPVEWEVVNVKYVIFYNRSNVSTFITSNAGILYEQLCCGCTFFIERCMSPHALNW